MVKNEAERVTVYRTEAESFNERLKQKVEFSGEKNVLNSYRSATYNFTLAALRKSLVDKPDQLREKEIDLVILRSGGKGTAGMSTSVDAIERKTSETAVDELGNQNIYLDTSGSKLVEDFNKESPGRFDMFIDNVEIKTLMAFSEQGSVTLPTAIKFEVFEPYSVNGFIEALHVSAIAAGYPSYLQASFVLKVEFIGYPDKDTLPVAVPIPNTVRYFPLGLTGVEVDISERGTRYTCTAVPYEQRAYGSPDVIKKGVNATGNTVKEILTDLLKKNIAEITKNSDEKTRNIKGMSDEYEVAFPTWDPVKGFDYSNDNVIAGKVFAQIDSDSILFSLNDPTKGSNRNDSVKKEIVTISTPPQVQFPEGIKIHEAITAIVRDSRYVRDIIQKPEVDPYGFIDYFSIRIEVSNLDKINPQTQKPYQKFTYVVAPYKVHYTRIPGLGTRIKNEAELKRLSLREYNYIYTGMNVDVINFKLQFNTLYFEAVPAQLGNTDQVATKETPKRTETADKKIAEPIGEQSAPDPTARQQVLSDASQTKINAGDQVTAGQPLSEYAAMAKSIHESITNSKASMITGEIEILGDPFYLVTGGMGSYNPTPVQNKKGHLGEGEAAYNYGEVLININFRNPIDIGNLNQGGFLNFDKRRAPFSGVYQVTEVSSTFKNGDFRQRLNIIRIPGQVVDQDIKSEDPTEYYGDKENPDKQVIPETSRALAPSQRLTEGAALSNIGRGTPITGLPGQLSNFTNATGGLGGTASPLLNQTPGFAANPLSAGSSIIGKTLPSDFLSNVRLSTSGLANLAQSSLGTAAITAAAANVITGNLAPQRLAGIIAGSVAAAAATPVLSRATDVALGAVKDPAALLNGLSSNAVSLASNLGASAAGLVNGVGDKVSALLSSAADPSAIAAKVGIDPSRISGLASSLQSKVMGEISNLTKNIPSDVNLNQSLGNGLALDFIPLNNIKNIPATAPALTAPQPEIDTAYLNEVVAKGGVSALENLYGVTNIKDISSNLVPDSVISSALESVPAIQKTVSGFLPTSLSSVDATIVANKMSTVKTQLSNITNQINVVDSGISGSVSSKFGSITNQSPLTKLINSLGNKTA